MCQDTQDDVMGIVQKLDAEIARYSKLGTKTRLERNRYMPVYRLPVEVLCRIFLYVRDASMPSSKRDAWRRKDIAWIAAVSHVCHHWRRVALEEVRLWVNPTGESFHWTQTMLNRSKNAPLSLKLSSFTSRQLFIPVSAHLSHIANLSIESYSNGLLKPILDLLEGAPTPILESLCLRCDNNTQDTPEARVASNALLETPRLRQLRLSDVLADWTSPMFSGLTTLKLRYLPFGWDPTYPQLWALLERLPELQELALTWYAEPEIQPLPDEIYVNHAHRKISLPNVKKLELQGRQPIMQFVNNNVEFSQAIQCVRLVIIHDHTSTLGQVMNDITHAFSTSLSPTSASACRKNRHSPLIFKIWADAPNGDPQERRLYPLEACVRRINLTASPSDPFADAEIDTGFIELFESFRWASLTGLELCELGKDSLPSADTLADTFGTLPSLVRVRVSRLTASLMVEVLQRGLEPKTDQSGQSQGQDHAVVTASQRRVSFPALKALMMTGVLFDISSDDSEETDQVTVRYRDFEKCLRNRRDAGVPIRAMELVECESEALDSRAFKETMHSSLNDLVDYLQWIFAEFEADFTSSEDEDESDGIP